MRCHHFPWGQGVETAGIKGECQAGHVATSSNFVFVGHFCYQMPVYDRSQQDWFPLDLFFVRFLTRLLLVKKKGKGCKSRHVGFIAFVGWENNFSFVRVVEVLFRLTWGKVAVWELNFGLSFSGIFGTFWQH